MYIGDFEGWKEWKFIKIRFLDGHVRQFSRMIWETRQPRKKYEYPAEIGITGGPDKPSVMFIGRLYKNLQEVKQGTYLSLAILSPHWTTGSLRIKPNFHLDKRINFFLFLSLYRGVVC